MFCPSCGVENSNEAKFCRACGSSLQKRARVPDQAETRPETALSRQSEGHTPGAKPAARSEAEATGKTWVKWSIVAALLIAVVSGGGYYGYTWYRGDQEKIRLVKPSDSSAPKSELEAKLNLQQGLNYARAKDYDNAINEFTLAIQKNPQMAVALSNRGIAYMQQKKFNKAMDDLQKAREMAPKDPVIHYNLAALYSAQNQLDRAMDFLDSALALGFADYDSLRRDPDLANARAHPDFRKILEKHKVFLR